MSEHLDVDDQRLWTAYEEYEASGRRREALSRLDEFVAALQAYPADRRRAWVEAISAEHWSGPTFPRIEGALTLRYPLLADLILPELLQGYREHRSHCARWLALYSLIPSGGIDAHIHDTLERLGLPEWYPPDLLREALAHDPSDEQAAHALILHLDDRFAYWTHHAPDYVLTDDTETWRRELDEFERLVRRYPTERDYDEDLREWRYHCDAWEEYLGRRDEFPRYAAFLAARGG